MAASARDARFTNGDRRLAVVQLLHVLQGFTSTMTPQPAARTCTQRTQRTQRAQRAPEHTHAHTRAHVHACAHARTHARTQFWLEGGSLIAAVRGGKMIPWDEDADVTMLDMSWDAMRAAIQCAAATSEQALPLPDGEPCGALFLDMMSFGAPAAAHAGYDGLTGIPGRIVHEVLSSSPSIRSHLACHMLDVGCRMSHAACRMSHVGML